MPHVDSVLVVVRSGRTSEERLRRTGELLSRMRVPVLGTVLIESARRVPRLALHGSSHSGSRRPRWERRPSEVPGEVHQP
jgi:Mrp family chromosome partitioning ATPase